MDLLLEKTNEPWVNSGVFIAKGLITAVATSALLRQAPISLLGAAGISCLCGWISVEMRREDKAAALLPGFIAGVQAVVLYTALQGIRAGDFGKLSLFSKIFVPILLAMSTAEFFHLKVYIRAAKPLFPSLGQGEE